jgi:putative cell wall-binding protein
MGNKFVGNIYPIILNNDVKNELKKYFGKHETKKIIAKTKVNYKDMIKNNHNIKVSKYAFENLCINTYFINLYTNIEKEISHDVFNKIRENILENCKILKTKNRIKNMFKKIVYKKWKQ